MREILDLPFYFGDKARYGKSCKNLFWFKKNKNVKWLKGQNFGDYLSFIIVGQILKQFELKKPKNNTKLLAIGSILHFAKDGDVIWGAGVNGKINPKRHTFSNLDVRMVRGPKTKEFLENKDIKVGNIFGDPGLLLPTLFPDLKPNPLPEKSIVIPNLNEINICKKNIPKNMKFVSPMNYWKKVALEILSSELVITSSLHGIVVAEAFGIPVRFVKPVGGETLFKYQDYYLGTNRNLQKEPNSFNKKITQKTGIEMPPPIFDKNIMIKSFPKYLFN